MAALHQRMAALFTVFGVVAFAWNVSTPANPDHVLNMVELGSVSVVSCVTYFLSTKAAEAVQVLMLAIIAFLPFGGVQSEPFIGAFIVMVGAALIWSYDGFKTRPWWKLAAMDAALLYFCAAATARFSAPGVEAFGRAAMWVAAINVGGMVLWWIVQEVIRRAMLGAMKQNRRLLEINKDLHTKMKAGGCADATERT